MRRRRLQYLAHQNGNSGDNDDSKNSANSPGNGDADGKKRCATEESAGATSNKKMKVDLSSDEDTEEDGTVGGTVLGPALGKVDMLYSVHNKLMYYRYKGKNNFVMKNGSNKCEIVDLPCAIAFFKDAGVRNPLVYSLNNPRNGTPMHFRAVVSTEYPLIITHGGRKSMSFRFKVFYEQYLM